MRGDPGEDPASGTAMDPYPKRMRSSSPHRHAAPRTGFAGVALGFLALLVASACTPAPAPQTTAVPSGPPAAGARSERPITAAEFDGHLRFLSSDLLEGRAPATRGGRLTTEYLEAQLRMAGLEPGMADGYRQRVPLEVVDANTSSMRAVASGRAAATLAHPQEVVLWAGSAVERSAASGELVFVGFGVNAPEQRWDDFKDVDVRGKILLILVNDPPATTEEPALFGGRAMTYYGRWTYKFEEAERRGAVGALIVHTTEAAGYPWQTVVGSWAKAQNMVPRDPRLPAPLGVRGWITARAANGLLAQAGLDLRELERRAATREFRPVATGIQLDLAFQNTIERRESDNVVAIVRGSDSRLRDEYVTLSAHWDHLGIGPPVDGDSIYNGALDNASGVATLLVVARAAAEGPAPARSLMFVFVTAEESGLLGSAYFARNPPVPAERLVANLNSDMLNLSGRTRDIMALGEDKSSLGPALAALVQREGMRMSPDSRPEAGRFYRSDHFSFAMAGIPALSIQPGTDFEGRPEGWGVANNEEFNANHYHRPSDEYREDFDLSGALQLANLFLTFARQLADAPAAPTWNADAEFRRPVPATQ